MTTLKRTIVHALTAGLFVLIFSGFIPGRCAAQSMEDLIQQLGIKELATDYLAPGAEAVGTTLNSGLFNTAKIKKGFHIRIGASVMWTFVPMDKMTFTSTLPATVTAEGYPSSITSASIFGEKGAVLTSPSRQPNGQPYPDIKLPDGLNMKELFFALPQMTVGSLAASEIMVRGIPAATFETEIGQVSFIGLGIRHSPSQYLTRLPFDISFMAAMQTFTVGDLLDVSTVSYGLILSKSLRLFTLFGGISYETYDINIKYTYTPTGTNIPPQYQQPQQISLQFTDDTFRYSIGATLTPFPFMDFSAAYSFGVHENLTFGASFGF
jgi:hypothetical protein